MCRNLLRSLTLCAVLAGCADDAARPSEPEKNREQNPGPSSESQVNPGGNSGSEGSLNPCEPSTKTLETPDTPSTRVGVSATSMLELANRQPQLSLAWHTLDAGPKFETSSTTATLQVRARGPAIETICDDPSFPDKYRPKPRVELPVVITLRSPDGALDERIEAVLWSERPERAETDAIMLDAAAVGGSAGKAANQFYTAGHDDFLFEFIFTAEGARGWMGGPFSPHKSRPCAYTSYVEWPPHAACWPHRAGEPSDDVDAMQPHIARLNRSFELRWNDRPDQPTQAKLEVQLAEGETCRDGDQISHPVRVRIVTTDGRVDVTFPAELSGGPSTIDPWPANLRDVEPFSLDLTGGNALDAKALHDHLGYTAPNVSAAIVSFYISSPSGIQSPVLSGMLRITPIDRSGFDTPLPTVDLPWGDSESCFSAGGTAGPVVRGDLELH